MRIQDSECTIYLFDCLSITIYYKYYTIIYYTIQCVIDFTDTINDIFESLNCDHIPYHTISIVDAQ